MDDVIDFGPLVHNSRSQLPGSRHLPFARQGIGALGKCCVNLTHYEYIS